MDEWFRSTVANVTFVQDNESLSTKAGTVRGMHFQAPPSAQGKLVRCISGKIFDVALDIRCGSVTFGKWIGVELSAQNGDQLWIPPGFAHGFVTLKPNSVVLYRVTRRYDPASERGVLWSDPDIGIEWPVDADEAILSEKDKKQPRLVDLPTSLTKATE